MLAEITIAISIAKYLSRGISAFIESKAVVYCDLCGDDVIRVYQKTMPKNGRRWAILKAKIALYAKVISAVLGDPMPQLPNPKKS